MKTLIPILAFTLLLSGCGRAPVAEPPAKWEYKTVEIENGNKEAYNRALKGTNGTPNWKMLTFLERDDGNFYFEELDKYGSAGWELVSAVPQLETKYAEDYGGQKYPNVRTSKIILLFKRRS